LKPLAGWELPECFATLRRRLEDERAGDGTREYIRVLRLLEKHSLPDVRRAVEQALRVGVVIRDAVAQFLWPQEPWRVTVFRFDGHPHLRHVQVAARCVPFATGSMSGLSGLSSVSFIPFVSPFQTPRAMSCFPTVGVGR